MKKRYLKKALAALLALMMGVSLIGCGSTSKEQENIKDTAKNTENTSETSKDTESTTAVSSEGVVTITFANFSASGGNEETLEEMYKEFQKEYPNIKIEIETIGYDDYFTQMQTRVAGNTAPDCYELNIENFAAYAAKGVLSEVSGVDTGEINQTALNAFNVAGTQYGIPGSFSNVVLVYNKDLFDQAGIDYPTDDWTWDEAQSAAVKISSLGDDIFGIYAPVTYNEFFKVAAQYGGSLLNEDKTEFTINSEENLKAAEMMIGRVTDSNVQPTESQMSGMDDWSLFESGRLGMIVTGIWSFGTFAEECEFDWDISVEPGGTQKATHFFSNAYVVNADSDKTKAATIWINWLASSDAASKLRIANNWDLPAITDEGVLSAYLDITPPENRQAVFDSLEHLVTPPIIEEYSLMSDIITEKLGEAAYGKITSREALEQAQEKCESRITLK